MENYDNAYLESLVEEDRVHSAVYTDPDIFKLEMERIWGKAWIYVGHESQVKEVGDFYATEIATQPVVMTGTLIMRFTFCLTAVPIRGRRL